MCIRARGEAAGPVRPWLVTQAFRGRQTLAIRQGRWKYLAHEGSGGNNYQQGRLQQYSLPELLSGATDQLYDLETDPGETRNLANERREIADELRELLQQVQGSGP